MSRDSSKDNIKPFLAALSESVDSLEKDESVYAPTRKLPNIPIQLSELYEDDSFTQNSSAIEAQLTYESNSIGEDQLITQSNLYHPSFETFDKKPTAEPQPSFPSFEVKLDPNSTTARFEKDKMLKEQIESVDFYIEQGFLDVAFSTLERLEMVFPGHSLISERLERMASLEIEKTSQGIAVPILSSTIAASEIIVREHNTNLNESIFRVPNTAELQSIGELAPLDSEREMDFKNLVTNNITSDNTTPDNVKKIEKPADNEVMFREIPAELYQTITDDEEIENILNQVDTAAEIAAAQNGLSSLLIDESESETNVEEGLDNEFASHFNIGQAYFDIELFDDAIEEFQAAYRSIQYLGVNTEVFQCCMILGKCFRLKEMPRPALIWLRKAFDTKQYQEPERLDLLYEIAGVHEELGEQKKALEIYKEIAKVSPNYQDINKCISKLG